MTMPRMRTISEAFSEIKKADPSTALSPYTIRRLILDGRIPYVMSGNNYIIDLDTLESYLSHPAPPVLISRPSIRAVDEKRSGL